jgi:hypothetical protein
MARARLSPLTAFLNYNKPPARGSESASFLPLQAPCGWSFQMLDTIWAVPPIFRKGGAGRTFSRVFMSAAR